MPPAHGLHDSFTEEGFWWLKGNENKHVGGTLTFDPTNGAMLKLLGLLGDIPSSFTFPPNDDSTDFVVIHGVTKKGKAVTLLKAFNTTRQLNIPGIPNEAWKSNLLVIGIHLDNENDDNLFSKSYLRFDDIERWLEHKPFTDTYDHEERSLTVKANKPREVHFAHHEEFEVTSVGSLYSDNTPTTSFRIDVFSQLAITPRSSKSLNWHLSKAVRVQELAALCTGHYLRLTSLELRGPDETIGSIEKPREVHVYAQLIHSDMGKRPSHETPVISGPELLAINPQAIQVWFDQYEIFSPAIALFFTISGQKHMFTNVRLLLAIQALEVFHRRTSDESVMPTSDFPAFVQTLVAAIPPSADAKMREKLNGTYQYLNEPSLNQRLKSIVGELSDALGVTPPAFNAAYLRKLVDTRNYYTHFSEELRSNSRSAGYVLGQPPRDSIANATFLPTPRYPCEHDGFVARTPSRVFCAFGKSRGSSLVMCKCIFLLRLLIIFLSCATHSPLSITEGRFLGASLRWIGSAVAGCGA